IQQVTKGDFEVIQLVSVDARRGYVYYIASPEDPTRRFLYRSRLNGKGKPEQITPEEEKGHHSYDISPDNMYAIHTWSNHNQPPIIELIRLKDHKPITTLENNKELKQRFSQLDIQIKEFFRIKLDDGIELDGWMIKPPDFDPGKKYPVIFHVYGEPHGTTVQDNWSSRDLWHYFLSQNGYLVMSVDNRGTNVPRGREWRKSIYKQIGIQASYDQAEAARKILKWEFVDPERVGIWGSSGGGSMTLNCMFRFPGIYKTGIALSFISNQLLYDSFYQERFMDIPEENEYGYREGSPITHAHNLQGNLLLIHGSADDNCHYQSLEMLVNELIKHNRYFTMIEYPMRTHSLRERENSSLHLRTSMYKYFLQNLPAGGI
ncbi:MAG: S9 family peptidase, partial [Bacteroidetes bacterium]|nr:S9 family peptidase [Bacteroidota bacterium]